MPKVSGLFKYRAHCVAINALNLLLNQVLSTSPGRCVRRAEMEAVINQNISNIKSSPVGIVTVELCDNLDSSATLAVTDDLLAVGRGEEALAVHLLNLHPCVVCDVRVPLGTSHLQTWRFKLKSVFLLGTKLRPVLLRSRITVSNSETDFW